jgi:hypothetical protein
MQSPQPSAQLIEWDPARLVWADVSHWHPLQDAPAYAAANQAGLIGIKIAQDGAPAALGGSMLAAAEAAGLIVVGYEYGDVNPEEFLRVFPPRAGRIPCLDFEGDGITIELAARWIDVVTAAYGRSPWFYAGVNWAEAGAPLGTPMAKCRWWGPQYGPRLRMRPGVGVPVAWQFSQGLGGPPDCPLEHAGVKGRCDLNSLLVEIGELKSMAGIPVT